MEPRFSAMMMSFENTMVSPLNVSSQSAVDHQGSTAAGQRKRSSNKLVYHFLVLIDRLISEYRIT